MLPSCNSRHIFFGRSGWKLWMMRLRLKSTKPESSLSWMSLSNRSFHNSTSCREPESPKKAKTTNVAFSWNPIPRDGKDDETNEYSAVKFWMNIIDGTNQVNGLSKKQGAVATSTFARVEKNVRALSYLQVNPYAAMFQNDWIEELVNSSAWGFAHAVAAVLSNMSLDVPLNDIIKTDGDNVVVDFNGPVFDSVPKEMCPAIRQMLEKRLISLYYKDGPHTSGEPEKFKVRLKMKVVGGRLIGFDSVELVTRAMVKDDPTLKTYVKEAREVYQTGVFAYVRKLGSLAIDLMQVRGSSVVSFTVVMEVMVNCEEIFYVVDSPHGNPVQGHVINGDDDDTKLIPTSHLVRLENIVEFDLITRNFQLGSWMITDWDDLLQGNPWIEQWDENSE